MSSNCISTSLRRSRMPASSDRLRDSRLSTSPLLLQGRQCAEAFYLGQAD